MNKNKGVIVAALITVLIAAGLVYYRLYYSGLRSQVTLKDQASNVHLPNVGEQALKPGSRRPQASMVLHVNDPAGLRELMKQNVWLQDVLGSALGRGFAHGWAAFLQTKGEELKARFSGPLLDYLLDKVFAQPFAVTWLSDTDATGAAAFVVDAPKSAAAAAFETLSALTARGVLTANNCPGQDAGKDVKYKIVRWLVADHALYAALANNRMVVAAKPMAVLQGLCLALEQTRASKPALELALYPDRFGRESQLFSVLLGTKDDIRLPLALEGGRLVPKGISAALQTSAHLAVGAPTDELLRLIPEEMPIVTVLQLKLPRTLDGAALARFFKDGSGELVGRQAALLWDPNGKQDVALLWGAPAEKQALSDIFTGMNARVVCGHVVMTFDTAFGDRIERTCKGQGPALTHAQPDVLHGIKTQQSVALHLHLGALMSTAMVQAYKHEKHNAPLPPEMEQAKKQLEALPFFGFLGRVDGNTLVGEGFRS